MSDNLTTEFLQRHMEIFFIGLVSPVINKPIKMHLVLIFENLLTIMLSIEQNQDKVTDFYSQLFNEVNVLLFKDGVPEGVTEGALLVC
jgi:hypothetical protein